jgi:RNA polymerase sigma-70 factor (ECF subfamily)
MEKQHESLKQLFQQEFAKMVAVISKQFGLQHIEIAEDIVSETFLQAAESWGMNGLPPNPTAWLYTVAKQKTLYHFRRNKILEKKVLPAISRGQEQEEVMDEPDFSGQNIKDSQLQMLFAVCNPAIGGEAQIGLALRILCGFGIDEIAEAFLSNKETINKRLFRAKEKLRESKVIMVPVVEGMPSEKEIVNRLDSVLHTIYLLFSEGYYSKTQNQVLRKELCLEALRLGGMLTAYASTNLPKTNALMALMCYHASRFTARENTSGSPILYEQQNEELWDQELIKQGDFFLHHSAQGNEISSYHLEAGIAHWHCQKEDTPEKWNGILQLYDLLLQTNNSPGVALNRVFALYKARGREVALSEALKLDLADNHFYFVLLGELYRAVDKDQAIRHFKKAWSLAKTQTDKQTIQEKIDLL